jgi:hypothetical protein
MRYVRSSHHALVTCILTCCAIQCPRVLRAWRPVTCTCTCHTPRVRKCESLGGLHCLLVVQIPTPRAAHAGCGGRGGYVSPIDVSVPPRMCSVPSLCVLPCALSGTAGGHHLGPWWTHSTIKSSPEPPLASACRWQWLYTLYNPLVYRTPCWPPPTCLLFLQGAPRARRGLHEYIKIHAWRALGATAAGLPSNHTPVPSR